MSLVVTRGFGPNRNLKGSASHTVVTNLLEQNVVLAFSELNLVVAEIVEQNVVLAFSELNLVVLETGGTVVACREDCKSITIRQGETADPIEIASELGPADDPGWTCRQRLVTLEGVEVIAAVAVTDTVVRAGTPPGVFFNAFWTPTQMAIATGDFIWVVEVQNLTTTPPFNKEYHQLLTVQEQLLPP